MPTMRASTPSEVRVAGKDSDSARAAVIGFSSTL
jgi:hypothetical protein